MACGWLCHVPRHPCLHACRAIVLCCGAGFPRAVIEGRVARKWGRTGLSGPVGGAGKALDRSSTGVPPAGLEPAAYRLGGGCSSSELRGREPPRKKGPENPTYAIAPAALPWSITGTRAGPQGICPMRRDTASAP